MASKNVANRISAFDLRNQWKQRGLVRDYLSMNTLQPCDNFANTFVIRNSLVLVIVCIDNEDGRREPRAEKAAIGQLVQDLVKEYLACFKGQ